MRKREGEREKGEGSTGANKGPDAPAAAARRAGVIGCVYGCVCVCI